MASTHQHLSFSSSLVDVGIFRDTLLPSLAVHTPLAIIGYGASRYANLLDGKDWLWSSGQVLNAWYSSVGRRVIRGLPFSQVWWSILSRPERLLLTGVTLWGTRLFYSISRRTVTRKPDDAASSENDKDNPIYKTYKRDDNFWNKAFFTKFLPEALIQSIISLPFTAPFRHQGAVLSGYHPVLQSVSVGLFTTGLALEALADYQLEQFQASGQQSEEILREGVWSIVRHPNYLGDALIHLSFPLLLYSSDMLAPIELLGPITNYIFLRHIGGDAENEPSRTERYAKENPRKAAQFDAFRSQKNSFWPGLDEVKNRWVWTVLGCGVLGAALDQAWMAVAH